MNHQEIINRLRQIKEFLEQNKSNEALDLTNNLLKILNTKNNLVRYEQPPEKFKDNDE